MILIRSFNYILHNMKYTQKVQNAETFAQATCMFNVKGIVDPTMKILS